MDLSTFIVTVFCLVDDWLEGRKLRQRGPAPKLSDSEVLTMEIVGEYLSSVTKWTKEEEFPKLRARIVGGNPAVLGLIVQRISHWRGQPNAPAIPHIATRYN